MTHPLPWRHDDGGRAAAGFRGRADDCVCRAVAIAARRPYREVYDTIAAWNAQHGRTRSAREGVANRHLRALMASVGGMWTPTMTIGSGTTTHLAVGELPEGRIVARVTRHVVAVIDGVVHDDHDPSRGGMRAVYGYWRFCEQVPSNALP